MATHGDATCGRAGQTEDAADQRRLAGAVGTEEAEAAARLHRQRDIIERRAGAEASRHALTADNRITHRPNPDRRDPARGIRRLRPDARSRTRSGPCPVRSPADPSPPSPGRRAGPARVPCRHAAARSSPRRSVRTRRAARRSARVARDPARTTPSAARSSVDLRLVAVDVLDHSVEGSALHLDRNALAGR